MTRTLHESYYANYGGLSVADYVQRHIRESAAEMERMRRTVALVPEDVRTLLDVGAGHGVFLEELRAARGIAGVGVEVTQAKVDYGCSRGLDMRLGDASRLAFADRAFDAVLSCEVLEHLPFGVYESALGELARVARRWVILTVPYDERRRFIRCPYCSARVNPDYHLRSFAPGSLGRLLPGWQLQQELALGEQRHSPLLDLGRRLMAGWPSFLVCPCCGYQPPAHGPGTAAGSQAGPRSLAQRAARWIPARRRPVWLVGIFGRQDQEPGHA